MREKFKDYVKSIEVACGTTGEYVTLLKYDKQKEAVEKIISRGKVISNISGVLVKVNYKEKELSISGGKILIKSAQNIEEVKNLLNELLD